MAGVVFGRNFDGVGIWEVNEQPPRSGFGRTLIERGLPYDLGAVTALEFTPSGVRCAVELPVGPRVIPAGD